MRNVINRKETIVGFVVTSVTSDGNSISTGQCGLGELPQYLRDAIDQFNAKQLSELNIDKPAK